MEESTATEIAFSVSPLSTHYPFFSWWGIAEKKFFFSLVGIFSAGVTHPIFDLWCICSVTPGPFAERR